MNKAATLRRACVLSVTDHAADLSPRDAVTTTTIFTLSGEISGAERVEQALGRFGNQKKPGPKQPAPVRLTKKQYPWFIQAG
jgi:hypothetical protein